MINRFLSKYFRRLETIANFHETGCYHPDLNVENILIDESQKVFLLDFDRWKRKEESKKLGVTNIERLKSSIRKRLGSMGLPFPEKEWRGLLGNLLLPHVEKNEHYNHIKVLSYEQGC